MSVPAPTRSSARPIQVQRLGAIAIGLLFTAAQVARTLADDGVYGRLWLYVGLLAVYSILLALVVLRPNLHLGIVHASMVVQIAIVVVLVAINPFMDYVTSFLIPVAFQAALHFRGRVLLAWVVGLTILCTAPLMLFLGLLPGLALSLVTMAGVIMIPAYVVVSHEIELARQRSQALLNELQETNHSLRAYSAQVEELAVIEERNRVARELHDTVSQIIFSIALTSRSAEILLQKDPARVAAQLEQLQEMTAAALAELRSLITQMREPQS